MICAHKNIILLVATIYALGERIILYVMHRDMLDQCKKNPNNAIGRELEKSRYNKSL